LFLPACFVVWNFFPPIFFGPYSQVPLIPKNGRITGNRSVATNTREAIIIKDKDNKEIE
jgi:hypothetical protein